MPLTRNSITVDPTGHSTDVTITNVYDDEVVAYSSLNGSSAVSFPDTITTATTYYLTDGGDYTVSGTVGGVEVGPSAPVAARYGVPARVQTPVDPAALIGGGGSVLGAPCWFQNQTSHALTADVTYRVPFEALTDGVAAGTDLIPDDDTLKCVTPGTYLVSAIAIVNALDGSGVTGLFSILDYNDDSAGPLYYLEPLEVVKDIADPASTQYRHIYPMAPIQLVADDILWLEVNPAAGNATLGSTFFYAIRIG